MKIKLPSHGLLGPIVLASGSWAGAWPLSAAHKTFFSGDGSHVALHSSTSSWCFSVFQPASCSPGEVTGGLREESGLTLEAGKGAAGWVQALCPMPCLCWVTSGIK